MSHTLLQAWAKTLRLRGDERAVVQASDGATVTFRQLHARVDAWLQFHAPEPDALRGRAVVFATPNGIGWLEIFLGLLKGGEVVVPLDRPAAAAGVHGGSIARRRAAGDSDDGHPPA